MRCVVDRRAQPSENNGMLTIAGERGEVLKAAVEHAVPSRGHTDSEELRSGIHNSTSRIWIALTSFGAPAPEWT